MKKLTGTVSTEGAAGIEGTAGTKKAIGSEKTAAIVEAVGLLQMLQSSALED